MVVISIQISSVLMFFFFFKQKTAYEIGTGDWSSDVCSSDPGFYYAACRWEHGTIASDMLAFWRILPVNLPATISSVQVPVLSHKNVVASEASKSRLVVLIDTSTGI